MTTVAGSDAFAAAYEVAGVGGLTGQVFQGYGAGVVGFGKFIQVILSLSVIGVCVGESIKPSKIPRLLLIEIQSISIPLALIFKRLDWDFSRSLASYGLLLAVLSFWLPLWQDGIILLP